MEKLRKNKLALAIFAFAVFAVLFFSANHQDPSRPPELSIQLTKGSNLAGSLTLDRDIGCYLNGQTYTNQQVAAYQAPAGQQPTEIKAGIYLYHLPENRTINQIFAGIVPRAENKITLAYFASSNNPTNNFSTFPALPGSLPLNENSVIPANEGFLLISCKDTAAFGLKNSSQYAAALPAAFETRSGNWVLSALPQGFDNRAHNLTEFWPQRTERYADFSDPARVRVIAFAEEHNQANPYDLNAASNKLAWLKVIPTPPVVEPPTLDPEEVDAVRNGDDLNDQIYDLDANNPDNFPIPPVNPLDDFGRQMDAILEEQAQENNDRILDFIPEFENDRIVDLPLAQFANFEQVDRLTPDQVAGAFNNLQAIQEHEALVVEVRSKRHDLGRFARQAYYDQSFSAFNREDALAACQETRTSCLDPNWQTLRGDAHNARCEDNYESCRASLPNEEVPFDELVSSSNAYQELNAAFDRYESFLSSHPQFTNVFNQPCETAADIGNRADRDSKLCNRDGMRNEFRYSTVTGLGQGNRPLVRLNENDIMEGYIEAGNFWVIASNLDFFLQKNQALNAAKNNISSNIPSAQSINARLAAWELGDTTRTIRDPFYNSLRSLLNDLVRLQDAYFNEELGNLPLQRAQLQTEIQRLDEIIGTLIISLDSNEGALIEKFIGQLQTFDEIMATPRNRFPSQMSCNAQYPEMNSRRAGLVAACMQPLLDVYAAKDELLATVEDLITVLLADLGDFLVNTQNPQIFTR